MDAPLAEALAVDSGSEDEEELTVEQLNELLRDDDPNDNPRENEDDDLSGQDVDFEFTWSEDYNAFTATREDFQEEVGSRIAGTSPCDLFCQLWEKNPSWSQSSKRRTGTLGRRLPRRQNRK